MATGSASELPWAGLPGEEEGGREPFISGLPAEVVIGFYRDQCERANAIVAATPLPALRRLRSAISVCPPLRLWGSSAWRVR